MPISFLHAGVQPYMANCVFSTALHASPDLSIVTTGSSGDEPSIFMRLPYDLRVMVYEIALTRVEALDIILFPSDERLKASAPIITPAAILDEAHLTPTILRLNKMISSEAMPFLYARNTFTFVGLDDCQAFTDSAIQGRALITRICLHRMAMSRPICRWSSLHTVLPSDLKQFTIEVDTYSTSLLLLCRSLCRGLSICLKEIADEQTRWSYFKNVVKLQFRTTKYLHGRVFAATGGCSIDSQRRLWNRLGESLYISHAETEHRFKDIVQDALVRDGVFGTVHEKVRQVGKMVKDHA